MDSSWAGVKAFAFRTSGTKVPLSEITFQTALHLWRFPIAGPDIANCWALNGNLKGYRTREGARRGDYRKTVCPQWPVRKEVIAHLFGLRMHAIIRRSIWIPDGFYLVYLTSTRQLSSCAVRACPFVCSLSQRKFLRALSNKPVASSRAKTCAKQSGVIGPLWISRAASTSASPRYARPARQPLAAKLHPHGP